MKKLLGRSGIEVDALGLGALLHGPLTRSQLARWRGSSPDRARLRGASVPGACTRVRVPGVHRGRYSPV